MKKTLLVLMFAVFVSVPFLSSAQLAPVSGLAAVCASVDQLYAITKSSIDGGSLSVGDLQQVIVMVGQLINMQMTCSGGIQIDQAGTAPKLFGSVPDTDSACGPANNIPTQFTPAADGLCLAGTASGLTPYGSPITHFGWSCVGTNTTKTCGAPKQTCVGLNGSLGAVVPGNNNQCCPGLEPQIPTGIVGTMGICVVSQANPAVSGVCGSSNGGEYQSAPTENLCSTGTNSGAFARAGAYSTDPDYYWTCYGNNGGTSASCKAKNIAVTPVCGTREASLYPPTDLCRYGSPTQIVSNINGTYPSWNWNCKTTNAETGCSASKIVSSAIQGVCGTSANTPSSVQPESNLCATGNPSTVNLVSGKWTWECRGSGVGGFGATCQALKTTASAVYGSCGKANGTSFGPNNQPSVADRCSSGTASALQAGGNTWTWTCGGSNGGTTDSCTANFVLAPAPEPFACGAAQNNAPSATAPATNLCLAGTPTTPYSSGTAWLWMCIGPTGGKANCSASRTVLPGCGVANGGRFSDTPSTNLCSEGILSGFGTSAKGWSWRCVGSDNRSAYCSAINSNITPPAETKTITNVRTSGTSFKRGDRVNFTWSSTGMSEDDVVLIRTRVNNPGTSAEYSDMGGWLIGSNPTSVNPADNANRHIFNSGTGAWLIPTSATEIPDGTYIIQIFRYDPSLTGGNGSGATDPVGNSNTFTISGSQVLKTGKLDQMAGVLQAIQEIVNALKN